MSNFDVRGVKIVNFDNLFDMLDQLKDQIISGNNALYSVCAFINKNKKYEQIIYSILDKNLKIRCGTNTINSVFTNLVPEFSVSLANNLSDVSEGFINFETGFFYNFYIFQ